MIQNIYICVRVKYQLFLSDFSESRIFSTDVLKNTQILIFIPPVGAESLHANRWTDMTKLIVTFRVFANELKNGDCLNIS